MKSSFYLFAPHTHTSSTINHHPHGPPLIENQSRMMGQKEVGRSKKEILNK